MEKYDLIIVGAGPAGIFTAEPAHMLWAGKPAIMAQQIARQGFFGNERGAPSVLRTATPLNASPP